MLDPESQKIDIVVPKQTPVLPPRSQVPRVIGMIFLGILTIGLFFGLAVYASPARIFNNLLKTPFMNQLFASLPRVAGVTTTGVVPADENNPYCPERLSLEPPAGSQVIQLPAAYNNVVNGNTLPPLTTGIYVTTAPISITGKLVTQGNVSIYAPSISITGTSGAIVADASGNNGGAGGKGVYDRRAHKFIGTMATSGFGYCVDGTPGCTPDGSAGTVANPAGGGGTRADYVNPDGASGAGYGGLGGAGSNSSRAPGGAINFDPPDVQAYNIRMGSGGGGGFCDQGTPGCYGGRGGGSIALYASDITISGKVTSNGQGGKNLSIGSGSTNVQAAGGGGSGGGVLISGSVVNITGTLQAIGGTGGNSCRDPINCPDDDDAGGGGSGGTIKIFYDPTAGTSVTPAASQVNVNGGAAGHQVRDNRPLAGNGGYFTSSPCTPTTTNFCDATHFQFAMPRYGQDPAPGARLFYGVALSLNGLANKNITVRHVVDPIEDNADLQVALSYGDWHGVKFATTQNTFYKACFDHKRGGAFPGQLTNSLVDFGDQNAGYFSVGVVTPSTGAESVLRDSMVPPASDNWQHEEATFQASATGENSLAFRTGSFYKGWFTGSLDLDNVGVFSCGSDASCASVSCDITSAANLVTNVSQDATFDSGSGPTTDWTHPTAAPTANAASTRAHLSEAAPHLGYLEIRSTNYFPQAKDSCGPRCYQWTGTTPLNSADLQLYSISLIGSSNLCGINFRHDGYASVDAPGGEQCTGSRGISTTINSCNGAAPTAQIIGPLSVCQGESANFSGNVSHPDPSVDVHQYEWSTSGPAIQPSGFLPITDQVGTVVDGTVGDVGSFNFDLTLRVKSSGTTFPEASDTKTISVVQCPNEPAEDVHAGGRTALNPPPGTADLKSQILKWLEIPGILP